MTTGSWIGDLYVGALLGALAFFVALLLAWWWSGTRSALALLSWMAKRKYLRGRARR